VSKNIYKDNYAEYLNKGLQVIPDKYKSKMPAVKGWSDWCYKPVPPDQANQWASDIPESGISLCLGEASGVVALDFDAVDPKIIEIVEALLPESPVEKKGSKGWTRFFKYNGERTGAVKYNGEVVFEVLSSGRKTTMPPSVHPNGANYIWTGSDILDANLEELPMLPPYLEKQIESLLVSQLGGESREFGKIINGRNAALSTYLGTLLNDKSMTADSTVKMLLQYDKDHNETPYFSDPEEHRHTSSFTNALTFYTTHLESINARNFRENKEYLEPVMQVVDDIESLKERARKKSQAQVSQKSSKKREFLLAPNALTSICETIDANSWVKQPELALGSALAMIATLGCRKFTFQGMAPNLYICNISPSGTGKNAGIDAVRNMMHENGAHHLLGAGDYVSNASLVDSLQSKPTRLDVMDEVGGKLKTMNGGKAEYADKIGDILAELYTSSNSRYMGRALASMNGAPSVRGACDKPCVNILGATTPTGFREGVTKDAIAKGLMGRFILFFGDSKNKSERVKNVTQLPEDIKNHLHKLAKFDYKQDEVNALSEYPKDTYEMQATNEANAALDIIFREFDSLRLAKIGTPEAPIAARLYQQMVKLCMVHAISRPFDKLPEIRIEDVQFAKGIIKCYYDELENIVTKYIFNSKLEKDRYDVLDLIESRGVVKAHELVRLTPQFHKRQRQGVIEDLIDAEYIGVDIEKDLEAGKQYNIYYTKPDIV